MIILALILFNLVWTISSVLLDAWAARRQRANPTGWPAPDQPRSIADEIQEWLSNQ